MKRISEILLIASTKFEVNQIIEFFSLMKESNNNLKSYKYKNLNVDVLISGIGIPSTTYLLTKILLKKEYDLAINVGICGSFNKSIKVGDVVNVVEDEFADIGITEANNNFTSLFDEGFIKENEFPFINRKLISNFSGNLISLKEVKGITVNSTSGNYEQIKMRKAKFNADVETMEGAAVAYVCLIENVKFIQIRAISNPVEPRNKDNWNIPMAIKNLTNSVVKILQNL
ncbi:MAG: futalosine hydrolase [Chlorobi bacterium]|nr:futalosine hydrolase [Chlorobiota bacterium]